MDRRLVVLAALTPVLMLVATRFPVAILVTSILVPATAIAWAVKEGPRAWGLAMAPGAVVAVLALPSAFPEYVSASLAGLLVASALRRGRGARAGLSWGTVPFAAGMLFLAASGTQPFDAEAKEAFEKMFAGAAERGEISLERFSELQVSFDVAMSVLERTWVVMDTIRFWAFLALGYLFARRYLRGEGLPRVALLSRLDLPDAVVWGLIAGLALILLGGSFAGSATEIVGWNLAGGAALLFALQGLAIERHWLARLGVAAPARGFLVAGMALFFLPLYLTVTAGIGLLDSWFDYRKLRSGAEDTNPLGLFRRRSADDSNDKD